MSKDELKDQINEVLDHLSQDALGRLLQVLRGIKPSQKSMFSPDQVERVLKEDQELLRKLAQ